MPVYLAPAKINLTLHVTGKREDGYHLLDSLTVFAADIQDRITIEPAAKFSLSVTGPFGPDLEQKSDENLIERAIKELGALCSRETNADLQVQKNIPLGAGLGGGSADAAATIRGLCDVWNIQPGKEKMDELLLSLGADVPVCYHGKTCRFQGIGNIISSSPILPPVFLLLVYPGGHSSTKKVFQNRKGPFTDAHTLPSRFDSVSDFVTFLENQKNDLYEAACALTPSIGEAKNMVAAQAGCLLTRMSGSGSSIFGVFENHEDAIRAQKNVCKHRPTWWAETTRIC